MRNVYLTRGAHVACLCLLVLAGCAKSEPDPSTKPTPTLTWETPKGAATFAGETGRIGFDLSGPSYAASATSLPTGSTLKLGNLSTGLDTSLSAQLRVEVSEKLKALSVKDAFSTTNELDPGVNVEVVFPGNRVVRFPAPARDTRYALVRWYANAGKGPLLFAGETAAPRKEHTLFKYQEIIMGDPVVFGPAKTVSEIDWIALPIDLPPRSGRTCAGYKKSGAGAGEDSFVLSMRDQDITIYDRLSGKKIDSKSFPGEDRCPEMAFARGGILYSYPKEEPIVAWLKSHVPAAAAPKKK